MMDGIFMNDVFISYSSKDRAIADAVLNALESRKIKCWIAHRDENVGDDYAAGIVRAIKACQIVVLIYSKNSNVSKQVLNEINCATGAERIILPFKIDDFLPEESFQYYLGKTHWLDAITPPVEKHIEVLCEKVSAIIGNRENRTSVTNAREEVSSSASKTASNTCRTARYEELIALGYTSSSIAMQLVENDYINCNGIGLANEGTAAQWEELLRDYNDSVIYLLDSQNNIIGDFNMIALPDHLMDKVKKGEFIESELAYSDVEFIGFPGEYNGYILAMSILPDYRNTKNTMLLLNAWLDYLEELSRQGVFFKKWGINVFSPDIETLVRGMGFNYLCNNVEFGKIYALDFIPIPQVKFFRQRKEMVKNYEQYYNETL